MRFIIFTLLLLFTLTSMAAPFEFTGGFRYEGELKHSSAYIVKVQRVYSEAQRTELSKLKNSGFSCKYMGQKTYRCKKHDINMMPRQSKITQLERRLDDEYLHFYNSSRGYEILSESSGLSRYRYHQTIEFKGQFYDYFDYQISNYSDHSVHKIIIPSSNKDEFIVINSQSLDRVSPIRYQESGDMFFHQYRGAFRSQQ